MGSISKLLKELLSELDYAIERNVESLDIALKGDVDILIDHADYHRFMKRALSSGALISATDSYGGARIFLFCNQKSIKRINCFVSNRGIPR